MKNNSSFLKRIIKVIASESVADYMKKIYSPAEYDRKITEFYIRKILLSFSIMLAGLFIATLSHFITATNSEIKENSYIERNKFGQGKKEVDAYVYLENSPDPKEITISVDEQRYSRKEIEIFSQKLQGELCGYILGNNESPDKVTDKLRFDKKIEGYPFLLSYSTDNPMIVDSSGIINYSKLEERDKENEGIIIGITVSYEYFEFSADYKFFIRAFCKEKTPEEVFYEGITEKLNAENRRTSGEYYMKLPESIYGKKIYIEEKKNGNELFIVIMSLVLSFGLYCGKDSEIKKEYEKRNQEMLMDYPNIVNKFALFYNAGMPVKMIWNRICSDYTEQKKNDEKVRAVYEEMILTNTSIKEGIGEIEAYENFSKRVGLTKYRNLISILEQALSKGKRDVSISLLKESEDAFFERKLNAKKMSEEASTKLLVPMFMMLFVVIAIIVFPAFFSFSVS